VHIGQPAAAFVPKIAQLAQDFRVVVLARGLVDAHGMEMRYMGEKVGPVAITADNPPAVSEDPDDTAVFPVAFLVPVGHLHQARPILAHAVAFGRHSLHITYEARPWAFIEFVKHRGCMFQCHSFTSVSVSLQLSLVHDLPRNRSVTSFHLPFTVCICTSLEYLKFRSLCKYPVGITHRQVGGRRG